MPPAGRGRTNLYLRNIRGSGVTPRSLVLLDLPCPPCTTSASHMTAPSLPACKVGMGPRPLCLSRFFGGLCLSRPAESTPWSRGSCGIEPGQDPGQPRVQQWAERGLPWLHSLQCPLLSLGTVVPQFPGPGDRLSSHPLGCLPIGVAVQGQPLHGGSLDRTSTPGQWIVVHVCTQATAAPVTADGGWALAGWPALEPPTPLWVLPAELEPQLAAAGARGCGINTALVNKEASQVGLGS